MKHLKGTSSHDLMYGRAKSDESQLEGFVDSDFAGDLDGRKLISRYLFLINGCLISWKVSL